jgi:hypothetical protein
MRIIFITLFFAAQSVCFGQIVISSGTSVGASGDPEITASITGDVINNSDFDFSPTQFRLSLNGNESSVTGNWVLHGLSLTSGVSSLNGNMTVTSEMNFSEGILTVPETFKLLYTGNGENLIFDDNNPAVSYVDGMFFQQGAGIRKFPVGDGGQALPMIFRDVKTTTEIGVRAYSESASIEDQLPVTEVDNSRYWSIECNDLAGIQSPVSLYHYGVSFLNGTAVPIEADPGDLLAFNLGYSESSEYFVTSVQEVTKPLLAIGKVEEVTVRIHDLITPFDAGSGGSADNNGIFIENLFPTNTVTLMDRWGVTIKKWQNYRNHMDDAFFQTLTPGNYICIVEWTTQSGDVDNVSQMVTILKTN